MGGVIGQGVSDQAAGNSGGVKVICQEPHGQAGVVGDGQHRGFGSGGSIHSDSPIFQNRALFLLTNSGTVISLLRRQTR